MSYNTTNEADTYMSGNINNEGWFLLSDDDKEKYLTTAFRTLTFNNNYSLPEPPTDDEKVKYAEVEMSNILLIDSTFSTVNKLKGVGVNKYKVADFEIGISLDKSDNSLTRSNSRLPFIVEDLLYGYRVLPNLTYEIIRKW